MGSSDNDRERPAQGTEQFVWYCSLFMVVALLLADILLKLTGGYGLFPKIGGSCFI